YTFAPQSLSFANPLADRAADFAASLNQHRIAGRVALAGGGVVAGATVTLTGSQTATTTTDAVGNYEFRGLAAGGSYTVSASKTNYTVSPASAAFNDLGSDRTADFTAAPVNFNVGGRVTTAGGAAVSGVTVTLTGSQSAMATTDAVGAYSFSVTAGGDYTVTPSRAGYDLSPKSKSFAGLGADQAADFTAAPLNYTVGGRVTSGGAGLPGVTVTLSGSRSATATTDANGAYSFNVPAEGDYAVTPSKKHYTVTPASASFKALDGNKTADFAAALDRHAVRGRVADPNNYGLAGVEVTLSGSRSATTTTDAGGEFSFAGLDAGGGYSVTPAAPTLAFSPASQTFADLGADAYAVFVGTPARYRVAGRVTEQGAGLAGVTLELSGAHPALGAVGGRFTTGDDGSYSFEVTAGGDYAVTPSKRNYSFGPAAAAFNVVTSDRTADFAATPLPAFGFDAAAYAVAENGGSVTVTVTRAGDAAREATVVYHALGDTARRGSDFLVSIGRLTFAPGETSKTFSVFITDDAFVEGSESFTLTLTPGEGADDVTPASARVTIGDNDAASAAANPVDGEEFFVRQHYRDFFSREPDADGLAFWTGEINRCGADAACRDARRVSVSAAFFLSIEFQETGYLVYRLYKAAYGRAPGRVEEFMLDARVMGDGVVVGRAGWEQRLDANKASSIRAFVGRAQFAARHPAALTPAQFVDALFLGAGVTPAAAERQAAVDDFGGAATSADERARASALRRVAENAALARAEFNRAFVLMQYFGYLRRDPDETPDTNLDGYKYWLGKLDDFGGDYQKAEMVRAFLSSAEYRGRFGN
ncbi:MAG TPA: carboxypeptidase regulatory-like domain-containing protein, partial [Pyrinomonadaceae bacterium]